MKTYIAYGSNLYPNQMLRRCPDAKFAGTGKLINWQLVFQKSRTGFYANIVRSRGGIVPVVMWRLTEKDESTLDIYEGFPSCYKKQTLIVREVKDENGAERNDARGMAYILPSDRPYGMPSCRYYSILMYSYGLWKFPKDILDDSIIATQIAKQSNSFALKLQKSNKDTGV